MTHYLILAFVLLLDHWLANTERVVASSILGLLFRGMEFIIIAIAKTLE